MSSRFAKTLAAVATIAAVAVPSAAQARQGADDPRRRRRALVSLLYSSLRIARPLGS